MEIFWVILIVIAAYFLLVFVGLRLVAPLIGFGKYSPPTELPEDMKAAVLELETKSHDQKSYLQAVFDLIMQKNRNQWNHTRFQAARRLPRMFVKDLEEIWNTKDFIYCTAINYAVYASLVNSKYFKPEDIRPRHVFVNFVPHQYMQVRVGDKWIDVDPAGTGIRGKPLGTHLAGFG